MAPMNRSQILLLCAGVGLASAVYYSAVTFRRPVVRPSPLTAPVERAAKEFHQRNLSRWEAQGFASMSDRSALDAAVQELVAGRFPGPEVDELQLAEDIADFLYMFGARTPEEFFTRLPKNRLLLESCYADRFVHASYREASGEAMPSDLTSRQCFDYFWGRSRSQPGRPVGVGRTGVIEVGLSKPNPPEGPAPGTRLLAVVMPSQRMDAYDIAGHWVGPSATGFPGVTKPVPSFEKELEIHNQVLIASAFFPIKSSRDVVIPVGIRLYKSKDARHWNVLSVWHHHHLNIFWPY